jgi:hypothetical protein
MTPNGDHHASKLDCSLNHRRVHALQLVCVDWMRRCVRGIGHLAGHDHGGRVGDDGLARAAPPRPELGRPRGQQAGFHFDAVGVQIYACQMTATATVAWVFQAPEATLFGRRGKIAGKHFAGPTWQTNDGSLVVGAKVAAFVVDPTAIPWLLLQAVSHQGDGRMDEVTFIQRLETIGGIAPTTGCDTDHLGAVARIGYSATYFFYEAKDAAEGGDAK